MPSPSAQASAPTQRRPRVRKSIAHVPSSDTAQDQENAGQSLSGTSTAKTVARSKKSRSKSLGPGLDALQEVTGNRRKSASSFIPKSILKPTIPLSPIRDIPMRNPTRNGSPAKRGSSSPSKRTSGEDNVVLHSPTRGMEEDTESQDEVHKQRENGGDENELAEDPEAEGRRRRKADIQKQRDARRKSMAGRRVSFAPEATLHTWDTEVLQDSTTSTGSADSTRRASSFSSSQSSKSDRPGTPLDQVNADSTRCSPEHQRDAHRKKRRRSSGIPPMNFNDPDVLSSSPFSDSTAIDEDCNTANPSLDESNRSPSPQKGTDATLGNSTMQNLEEGADDDKDLDLSLEDAAKRAGTKTLDLDEHGDVSMEIAGDEVTAAFKPWVKQSMGAGSPHPGKRVAKSDQENVNPFLPSSVTEKGSPTPSNADDEDMSMDMTQAMGEILRPAQGSAPDQPGERYPKRRPNVRRRRSSGVLSDLADGTMELTAAVGGVQQASQHQSQDQGQVDENEELSMEFTSVFGGLKDLTSLSKETSKSAAPAAKSTSSKDQEQLRTDVLDEDVDMEMTEAMGSIEPQQQAGKVQEGAPTHDRETRKSTDVVESASSSFRIKAQAKPRPSIGASATGSPGFDPFARRDRLRRSGNAAETSTPDGKPSTPPEQVTPIPTMEKPTTPGKTPPSASVAMRKTTPKKLFQDELNTIKSPKATTPSLFTEDSHSGRHTPNVILAPKFDSPQRNSTNRNEPVSGGSPQIAAILDRRSSISNNADIFAPQGTSRGVRFEDPRAMDAEVSRERDEDHRRESGQFIMEQEADGAADEENATQSLKDLMQSMTPKKNKGKGRKSLAVGSAKGLLGKRPAELDGSDDEESPKTFGKLASPVKKIRLQGPPSAEETMRSSKNDGGPLSSTPGNVRPQTPIASSSPGQKTASTPKSQGRFKDAESFPSARKPVPTMGQTAPADAERSIRDAVEDKLGLQDFLNLTNIRFMELTTTKRRPTVAPQSPREPRDVDQGHGNDSNKMFEDAVVAGACTIPMLELFQHSCRELKKYISEGRGIVREIEAETLEENPPIFKEYTTAKPAERAAIDNQFKNMKTNARLLSKATWYEWRMKLLEGLQESLQETSQGLKEDDEILQKHEATVKDSLTEGREQRSTLEKKCQVLKARADELAHCDPEDLEAARQRLQTVSRDMETQSHELEEHLGATRDLDQALALAHEAKSTAQASIKECQRQREDSRGWSVAEVKAAQARVDSLVESSGWRIVSAHGSQLTFEHYSELLLSFNTAAFLPAAENTQQSPALTLAYSPAKWRTHPDTTTNNEPSTTQRFFLQLLRARLHSFDPRQTHASKLLQIVQSGWEMAKRTEDQTTQLNRRIGITTSRIVGDEKLVIESTLLLRETRSKVLTSFTLTAAATGLEVKASVAFDARVAYGTVKGLEGLGKKTRVGVEQGSWAEVVERLGNKAG